MRFAETIALGIALLTSLVAADDAFDVPDVDISITKWDTAGCQGDHVGEQRMKIEDGHCQTMANYFKSFLYGPSLMNRFMFWKDDWTNPTCKVIVYPLDSCQGLGWTPGPAAAGLNMCINVPEKQDWIDAANYTMIPNYQERFEEQLRMLKDQSELEGIWMRSVGVVCMPGLVAVDPFIMPNSAPFTEYELPPT
jgi:hypothetical protein